jgi:hypothetical protein
MQAADWLYGDEGHVLMTRGEEGTHWVPDDTYPVGFRIIGYQISYIDKLFGSEANKKLPRAVQDLGIRNSWLVMINDASDRFGTYNRMPGEERNTFYVSNIYKEFIENGYTIGADPVVTIPKSERTEVANIETPLKTYLTENVIKFIMDKRPMEEWEAFLGELQGMRADALVDAYNRNYIQ